MRNKNATRREGLKKIGSVTTALAVGATGSAAASPDGVSEQDTKDHYIRLRIDSGEGTPTYFISVPDPDPNLVNIENGLANQDEVTYYDTYTTVDGQLKGNAAPYYDELEFNGSLDSSNFDYSNVDPRITVIVDGQVVQEG